MPVIEAAATALPRYRLTQAEAKQLAARLFQSFHQAVDRYLSVFDYAAIDERYLCMPPEWYERDNPFSEKNRRFIDMACQLGKRPWTGVWRNPAVPPPTSIMSSWSPVRGLRRRV